MIRGLWKLPDGRDWLWGEVHKCVASIPLEEVDINHTLEPPSKWPTNWRTIIPKKFSHCCKGSRPHIRLSNLGIWQRSENPQVSRIEGFDYRTSSGWWKHRLLEGTNKTVHTKPRGKEKWPHKRLSQTCLTMSHAVQDHPVQTGHGGEFWQNVVCWRRE